ncbi:MAG: fumarylacetoacetate hydrolase family protein [Firmicutes bacterium]|nr:fumarylacetoacetate hydrolase family protein [Bacillota bacterium]
MGRAYTIAPGTVLLTGTGIVPDDAFTLRPGDVVSVAVEGVGELVNRCEWVGATRAGRGATGGDPSAPGGLREGGPSRGGGGGPRRAVRSP